MFWVWIHLVKIVLFTITDKARARGEDVKRVSVWWETKVEDGEVSHTPSLGSNKPILSHLYIARFSWLSFVSLLAIHFEFLPPYYNRLLSHVSFPYRCVYIRTVTIYARCVPSPSTEWFSLPHHVPTNSKRPRSAGCRWSRRGGWGRRKKFVLCTHSVRWKPTDNEAVTKRGMGRQNRQTDHLSPMFLYTLQWASLEKGD